MEQNGFKADLLKKNTWLIRGKGASAYLLVGNDRGMMIDSGEAEEDIHAFTASLTDRPVEIVANTHGHFDHTGGNGYFKCALMGRLAAEIAKQANGGQDLSKYPLEYPIIVIEDGFCIDLGNRVIETLKIGGHSPDSLAFLDKGERILFGGDSIQPMVPLKYKCTQPQPGMLRYVMDLSRILSRRDEYDYICGGHTAELLDGDLINHIMIAALRALDGELDEPPAPPAGRDPKKGPFALHDPANSGFCRCKDASVSFDRRYLRNAEEPCMIQGT